MALSGTYSFNPDIGELAEEAFERAGLEFQTANDMRTVRRSLNYLTLEWQNKGINLWTIDQVTIPSSTIVQGTDTYDIDIDTLAILDAVVRTDSGTSNQSDITIERISSSTYSRIPNKTTQGRPTQFWFQRVGIRDVDGTVTGDTVTPINRLSKITLWPVPDESNKYELIYWRTKRIADSNGTADTTMEVPALFLPALVAGLAYQIALKKPQAIQRVPLLKQIYEEVLEQAFEEGRTKEDMYIMPDLSAYTNYG